MRLAQLIYSSVPAIPIGTKELIDILEPSQALNRENGITGILAFSGDAFMQILEGADAAVDSTYARILQDPRHTSIRLLGRLSSATRDFSTWDMGYVGFRTFRREIVERYSLTGTLVCETLDAHRARRLLLEVADSAIAAPTSAP